MKECCKQGRHIPRINDNRNHEGFEIFAYFESVFDEELEGFRVVALQPKHLVLNQHAANCHEVREEDGCVAQELESLAVVAILVQMMEVFEEAEQEVDCNEAAHHFGHGNAKVSCL